MKRIMFVCHGNICRSPMAEFVFRNLVEQQGCQDRFYAASSATSTEEIGNPVHPGTRTKLAEFGISTQGKCAVQLQRRDYPNYDYFLGMDHRNVREMRRILGGDPEHKVRLLLEDAARPGDEIADPWYTGDFDQTYTDILEGCTALMDRLLREEPQ